MAAKLTELQASNLAEIVAAGPKGMYSAVKVHKELLAKGLVELNPNQTNEAGEIATRATQAGIDIIKGNEEMTEATEVQSNEIEIESGIEVPKVTGRGRQGSKYPFDSLEVDQSFFVPNSEKLENAAKSLASTVSAANSRYTVPAEDGTVRVSSKGETVPVMVKTRTFVLRAGEKDGVSGARIFRVA